MFDGNSPDLEELFEGLRAQYAAYLLAKSFDRFKLNIEIHVLRVSGTPEEEAQITAPLESIPLLIHLLPKLSKEQKMEKFDTLPVTKRSHFLSLDFN
jgi:hypothetical protein